MIMRKAKRRDTALSPAIRDCRIHTAYHEAGHVVVAYWYGWWLNSDGVEIDARWYTGVRTPKLYYSSEARVVQSMAGRIGEHKFHGLGDGRFDDCSALEQLELARRLHRGEVEDWEEEEEFWNDSLVTARALVEDNPAISDDEYVKALRAYQKKTRQILNKATVWRAVEKVATALLTTGRLTDAEARAAIGGEDIFGGGIPQTLRDHGLNADVVRKISLALSEASS